MNGLQRSVYTVLAALAFVPAVHAADALNGKNLYLNGPTGGGTTCASCHGPSPAANVNGILAAANNPSVITSAFIPPMRRPSPPASTATIRVEVIRKGPPNKKRAGPEGPACSQ